MRYVLALTAAALFDALTAAGHSVKVVATNAATYFFDVEEIRARRPTPRPPSLQGGGERGDGGIRERTRIVGAWLPLPAGRGE